MCLPTAVSKLGISNRASTLDWQLNREPQPVAIRKTVYELDGGGHNVVAQNGNEIRLRACTVTFRTSLRSSRCLVRVYVDTSFASPVERGLKTNQNAPRHSEHPPVRGEKMSKRLGGIKGCKYTKPLRGI